MGYNEDNQKREGPALLGCARPVDLLNVLLSFAYTLLINNCAAALESLGLDPDVGFPHPNRPGGDIRLVIANRKWAEFSHVFAPQFRVFYSVLSCNL